MRLRSAFAVLMGAWIVCGEASAHVLQWLQGFVENRGQWELPFLYVHARPGLTVGVLPTALVFDAYEQRVESTAHGRYEVPQQRVHRRGHVVWMEFEGARAAQAVPKLVEPTVLHFFRGSSPQRWCAGLPLARVIELPELYPGIGMRLWSLPEGPRYDFLVEPGADPGRIQLRLRGVEQAALSLQGRELALVAAGKAILLHANLQAYQEIGGQRREVPVHFALESHPEGGYRLRFVLGDYDRRYRLVIDPVVYATCIGSGADERMPSFRRLSDGSLLCVVQAEELSFRMTPGAYDTTYNGLTDAVVLKLDATLRQVLFATYLGGSGSELPVVVGTDANGEIYVGGSTNSADFPVRNAYQQSLRGGMDLFVTRLSPQGSQLRWSTYIGGSNDDIATTGSVRQDGIVVLAGRTQSSNYPTTSGAYQRTYAANWDVFLTALSNTGAALSFSTYLGGADNETAWAVATDPEGYTYLCGETSSSNFPNYPVPSQMNPGNRPYDRDYNGGTRDAFVAKFRPTSATLQYCTFLGGNAEDYATGIVPRDNGEVWVVGVTRSANFPVTGPPLQPQLAGGADAFVCRFSSSGLGTTALMYSTFLGGSADEEPRVVLEFNNAPVVIGWTRSGNFPITQDAHSRTIAGGQDLFVTYFADLTAQQLGYSSYLGTLRDERPLFAALDARGDLYISGETNSAALCQAGGEGFQTSYGGGNTDAFLLKYVRATLSLSSPRGGERFCAGSSLLVSWMASGTMPNDTFRIEISSDRSAWEVIGTAVGTSYSWNIPAQHPSGRYWLRVVHQATGLSDLSDSAFTIVQPPSITQQPPDTVRLCVGDTLVVQVGASGDSLSYQWYREGAPIPGAQQPELRLPITGVGQSGRYSVRIRGVCPPEQTSRLVFVSVEERPSIRQHPQDTSVQPGQRVCFQVAAAGGTSRQYQWLRNGMPIPGARDSVFCIQAVTAADTGEYRCVVWNRCGADTSRPARLSVTTVGVADEGRQGFQLEWIPSPQSPQRLRVHVPQAGSIRSVLYSLLGQPVAEGTTELVVEPLPSGVYWLVVEAGLRRWLHGVVLIR
jgi:hypothetical protein